MAAGLTHRMLKGHKMPESITRYRVLCFVEMFRLAEVLFGALFRSSKQQEYSLPIRSEQDRQVWHAGGVIELAVVIIVRRGDRSK